MSDEFAANFGMGLFAIVGLIRKADAALIDVCDVSRGVRCISSYPTIEKATEATRFKLTQERSELFKVGEALSFRDIISDGGDTQFLDLSFIHEIGIEVADLLGIAALGSALSG